MKTDALVEARKKHVQADIKWKAVKGHVIVRYILSLLPLLELKDLHTGVSGMFTWGFFRSDTDEIFDDCIEELVQWHRDQFNYKPQEISCLRSQLLSRSMKRDALKNFSFKLVFKGVLAIIDDMIADSIIHKNNDSIPLDLALKVDRISVNVANQEIGSIILKDIKSGEISSIDEVEDRIRKLISL